MEIINHGVGSVRPGPTGVGGWLLVLCAWLLAWQPIGLGLTASRIVSQIAFRGLPLALALAARVMVTGLGIAAGIALAGRRPGAVTLARAAVIASAAADVAMYSTTYFPSNRMPGDTPLYVTAALLYHGAWVAYLHRSKRVQKTFGG